VRETETERPAPPAPGANRPALREGRGGWGGSNGSPLVAVALSRWPHGGATGPAGDSRCVAGGGAGSALIGRRGRAWQRGDDDGRRHGRRGLLKAVGRDGIRRVDDRLAGPWPHAVDVLARDTS
jgi:hypothetical protein